MKVAFLGGCHRAPGQLSEPPVAGVRETREAYADHGVLYVRELGPPRAPPLVLIHGLGQHGGRDFDPLLPVLSQHHRVLTVDLPGFGRSAEASHAYTPERYAALVHQVLSEHFAEPVAVVGHSMGAGIAVMLAAEYPESVRSLALLDMAGVLHYRDYLHTVVRAQRQGDKPIVDTLKAIRTVLFEIGEWPVHNLKLESLEQRDDERLSAHRAAALLFIQQDFGPALRKIRAPVFVGWGRRDTIAPLRTAEALRHTLAPEQFQIFERSGHAPMQTEPKAVAEALERFFASRAREKPRPAVPLTTSRVGRCERRRDCVFEGDYARIEIRRAKRVQLRDVRTRSLVIDRAEVELMGVTVMDADVGVLVRRSEVRWSGGSIDAETCIDTDHSRLNLLALRCTATGQALRVRSPGVLMASASLVRRGELSLPLHGEYELFPTPAERGGDGIKEKTTERAGERDRQ